MSNREELTRQAERSLRLGRVDEAIAQYQELAYVAPIDWGVVKQLADLLERAGQREGAARQFARWADHLSVEGFHSKAAALYKKVLKLEPADEHALWQLGEVSLLLKLRADARLAFQRVAEIRQRRGDAPGAAAARERLASVEGMAVMLGAMPPGPSAAPVPAPVATPVVPSPAVMTPVPTFAAAHASAVTPAVSQSVMAAAPVIAPVQAPAVAPILPAPLTVATAPTVEPAFGGGVPTQARIVAPPETASERLARLRREAETADARGDRDADAAWLAVLDADPADAALRLRLVDTAIERGNLDVASRLSAALDAVDDASFVALVDLAHQGNRVGEVERLMADRIHAGGQPAYVLGLIDALSARRPRAARMALAAAIGAWTNAGHHGHAVAAFEAAQGRGLLTTAMYLQWVEICVDAGLPGLSRAQLALAGAYRAEHRLAEARALAEDVFVRELGTEPSRALLFDILDREGVDDPHRVLAELLAPPRQNVVDVDDAPVQLVETPAMAWPVAVEALPVEDVSFVAADIEVDRALTSVSIETLYASPPDLKAASPMVALPEPDALFDWSDLLGRDLEHFPTSEPMASPAAEPAVEVLIDAPVADVPVTPVETVVVESAPVEVEPEPEPALQAEPELAVVQEPAPAPEAPAPAPEPQPEPQAVAEPVAPDAPATEPPLPPEPVLEPAVAAGPDRSAVSDVSPRIGDLRAQPLLAEDAPLPPSFSTPKGWFSDSSGGASDDAPRRRAPEDDFFFDDDATPARWARPAVRSAAASATSLAGPVASAPTPPVVEPSLSHHVTLAAPPAAEVPHVEDTAVAVEAVSLPATIEEAVMPPPQDASPEPDEALESSEALGSTEVPPVEEEVDLTELLEELKQWDPVLPERRARERAEQPTEAAPIDVADEAVVTPQDEAMALERAVAALGAEVEGAVPTPLAHAPALTPEPAPSPVDNAEATELDAVFADMQRHGDDRVVAEQQLAAGRVFLAAGLVSEAARAFERASLEPRSRFEATLALAELHKSRSQVLDAVSWYEKAAMAPVPDAAVKRAVLYDLAESLEALGETDRALGVLLDLLSQVEDYRDARARLDRLLRVDAGG